MPEMKLSQERPLDWTLFLIFFGMVYYLGAPMALLNWVGFQMGGWPPEQVPFYAVIFVVGAAAVAGLWYWKRWGIYGLVGVWGGTVLVNRYFNVPVNWPYLLFGVFLILCFFWLVRRYWDRFS